MMFLRINLPLFCLFRSVLLVEHTKCMGKPKYHYGSNELPTTSLLALVAMEA